MGFGIGFAFAMLSLLGLTIETYRALDGLIAVQNQPLHLALSEDQAFLTFKAVLLAYVAAHPEITGAIPLDALGLERSVSTALKDAGAYVSTEGATVTVQSWAEMSPVTILKTITRARGDLSIGSSQGTTWTTPLVGTMGSLPTPIATGHVVSVVTFNKGSF
ncbi:MAG: hypothetical protein ABF537_02095 [Acetobacter sp.]|uniref:hypothetical protein n=1 Tax=Acetobacter sp. TaxID=440 RepID=UPI0039ECFCDC